MLFKSALVTQVSGSIGGLTGSHNAAGMYFRSRVIPVDPASNYQQDARSAVAQLVARWGALTPTQREVWAVYAANVPLTNRLGDSRYVSGLAHFVRCNVSRIVSEYHLTGGIVEDAPTIFDLGESSEMTIDGSEGSGDIKVTFADDAWVNTDGAVAFVHGSRPFSPAVNYFKGPYRWFLTIEGSELTPPASPATEKAPFRIFEGQQVGAYVRVQQADGRLSARQHMRCLVGE